jgi:hypothetical protein
MASRRMSSKSRGGVSDRPGLGRVVGWRESADGEFVPVIEVAVPVVIIASSSLGPLSAEHA